MLSILVIWGHVLGLTVCSSVLAAINPQGFAGGFRFDITHILANEELDPIVSPNGQSSHMHKVVGGSNFKAGYNYAEYAAANCSSISHQADKSNYWMPALYFRDNVTSTYKSVPANVRMYYFIVPNSPLQAVSPFPQGLRMLVGSPDNKTPGMKYAQFACQTDKKGGLTRTLGPDFNFPMDCDLGVRTELFFPACWDGYNLYKSDGSHMSYTSTGGSRAGPCPLSHPVKLPTLLLEYTWLTSRAKPGVPLAGNLMWANGDTTGLGIHGDFVNGWDIPTLTAALTSADCGVGTGVLHPSTDCPVLMTSWDDKVAKSCKPSAGILKEPLGNDDLTALAALPGCNPPWGATGPKPTCNPAVAKLSVNGLTTTNGPLSVSESARLDFRLPNTTSWTEVACTSLMPLTGGIRYNDDGVSAQSCQTSCSIRGFNFTSIGQRGPGWLCYCGNALNTSIGTAPGMCNVPCPGNQTDTCGGEYYYKTYYAGNTVAATIPQTPAAVSCYNNPPNKNDGLLGKAGYSFQSPAMTGEVCISACVSQNYTWGLTTSGNTCYCGNNLVSSYGPGAIVPSRFCATPCNGNSSETCGAHYFYSSVYNLDKVHQTSTQSPTGYLGCYPMGSAPAGDSWQTSTMTTTSCINDCKSLGYALAGLRSGTNCQCYNTFDRSQYLPASQCNTPCAGNQTTTCGAHYNVGLYNTSSSTVTPASISASKSDGYVGCFADQGQTQALLNYTYQSSTMTVETCVSACQQFGYNYAGVKAGSTCKCGNAYPQTHRYPPSLCITKCPGNPRETCGSTEALELYNASSKAHTAPNNGSTSSAYVGCYSDNPVFLTGQTFTVDTVETCRTGCLELGYALSGVRNGNNCRCGNSSNGARPLPNSSCSTVCQGNSSESCGGQNIISVWQSAGARPVAPQIKGWLGCYVDPSSARILPATSYWSGSLTGSACQNACAAQSYSYAGTEYGRQCWCANSIASSAIRTAASQCSLPCSGSSTNETCGAINFISLYNSSLATNGIAGYRGCYSDSQTLNGWSFDSDWMSVGICTDLCRVNGYGFAGLRAGYQCRCGSTSPRMGVDPRQCQSHCTADSTQDCGTENGVAVYSLAKLPKIGGFTLNPSPSGYAGCFTDSSTSRIMPALAYSSNSNLTTSTCRQGCSARGYNYAGLEGGNHCFCGNQLNATSHNYQVADSNCNSACTGGNGTCGGYYKLSVWTSQQSLQSNTTKARCLSKRRTRGRV